MSPFKIVLFAFIAILAVAAAMEHQSVQKAREDSAALRQQVDQLTPLIAETEHLSNLLAQASSSTPDQVLELAKLRAEVVRLRGQSHDLEAAKLQAQKSASEAAALRAQNADLTKAQEETQQQQIQATHQATLATTAQLECINNLRLIDSAKQQWALENKKQTTDTPTMEDLKPYLGRGPNGELPVCPSGGSYTVGTVGEPPKCSIPGHALP